jgi:hypothetical protein
MILHFKNSVLTIGYLQAIEFETEHKEKKCFIRS